MLEVTIYIILVALTGLYVIDHRSGLFGPSFIAPVADQPIILPIISMIGPSCQVEWHRRT